MSSELKPLGRPRKIKYHSSTQQGTTSSDYDNPLSANFRPPDERGQRGAARWWALWSQKFQKAGSVQFDG